MVPRDGGQVFDVGAAHPLDDDAIALGEDAEHLEALRNSPLRSSPNLRLLGDARTSTSQSRAALLS
jgi:hypothetical protein